MKRWVCVGVVFLGLMCVGCSVDPTPYRPASTTTTTPAQRASGAPPPASFYEPDPSKMPYEIRVTTCGIEEAVAEEARQEMLASYSLRPRTTELCVDEMPALERDAPMPNCPSNASMRRWKDDRVDEVECVRDDSVRHGLFRHTYWWGLRQGVFCEGQREGVWSQTDYDNLEQVTYHLGTKHGLAEIHDRYKGITLVLWDGDAKVLSQTIDCDGSLGQVVDHRVDEGFAPVALVAEEPMTSSHAIEFWDVQTVVVPSSASGDADTEVADDADNPPADTTKTTTGSGVYVGCCRYCGTGQPCGNGCISRSSTCRSAPGCACSGSAPKARKRRRSRSTYRRPSVRRGSRGYGGSKRSRKRSSYGRGK